MSTKTICVLNLKKNDFIKYLPHGDKFIYINSILKITRSSILGLNRFIKTNGHYKENLIVPGIFLVEYSAQLSLVLLNYWKLNLNGTPYLSSIKNFKFVKSVYPGNKVKCNSNLLLFKRNFYYFDCNLYSENVKVGSGDLIISFK